MAFGDGSVKPLFGEDGLFTEFDVARIMRFDTANESLDAIRVSSVFGVFFNVDGPDLEWDLEHDRDRCPRGSFGSTKLREVASVHDDQRGSGRSPPPVAIIRMPRIVQPTSLIVIQVHLGASERIAETAEIVRAVPVGRIPGNQRMGERSGIARLWIKEADDVSSLHLKHPSDPDRRVVGPRKREENRSHGATVEGPRRRRGIVLDGKATACNKPAIRERVANLHLAFSRGNVCAQERRPGASGRLWRIRVISVDLTKPIPEKLLGFHPEPVPHAIRHASILILRQLVRSPREQASEQGPKMHLGQLRLTLSHGREDLPECQGRMNVPARSIDRGREDVVPSGQKLRVHVRHTP